EDRYEPDFHPLDSYGARFSLAPDPHWALAASYGHLVEPEALHPDEDQDRLGASVLHSAPLGKRGEWASALVYGANQRRPHGGSAGDWEHSVILESNLQLDAANTVFGRLEYVRKAGDELALPVALTEQTFDVGALSFGYVREWARFGGATLGVGARGAINFVPEDLEGEYGSRTPVGVAVFVRVRPALLEGAGPGAMDAHMHH
ncbi:MAG: hypothetical protein ACJ8AY_07405, partial [Gemmatimonadales bacterium]